MLVPVGDGSTEHLGVEVERPGRLELLAGKLYELGRAEPADLVVAIPTVSGRHAMLRVGGWPGRLKHRQQQQRVQQRAAAGCSRSRGSCTHECVQLPQALSSWPCPHFPGRRRQHCQRDRLVVYEWHIY